MQSQKIFDRLPRRNNDFLPYIGCARSHQTPSVIILMKKRIYQTDAFADKVFSGNPAAVYPLDHRVEISGQGKLYLIGEIYPD